MAGVIAVAKLPSQAGVYAIHCDATGEVYVGASRDMRARQRCHLCLLRQGKHHARMLQEAFNAHGAITLRFESLELVGETTALRDREQFWLQLMRPALCRRTAVASNNTGIKWTYSQRVNASESQRLASMVRPVWNKGTTGLYSDAAIAKIKAARARQVCRTGYKWSEEARARHSALKKGAKMPPMSDEHRKHISEARINYFRRLRNEL
jgi:predicted GIY-YIG superfamily endonuclease